MANEFNLIGLQNLTGSEVLECSVGGAAGTSAFVTTGVIRNGSGLKLFSGSGAQTYTATAADSTLFWTGAAPTTWTITLPSPASDGEIIQIGTDTTLTTLVTVNAGAGQTMNAAYSAQTITAPASVEFQFNAATLKWYRVR